eukprot:gene33033-40768_t
MSFSVSSAPLALKYSAVAVSGNGQYLAACGGSTGSDYSNVYLSPDYGASWNISTDLPAGLYGDITSSTTGQNLVVCDFTAGISTSSDFGSTWSPSPNTHSVVASCGSALYSSSLVASNSGQYVSSLTITGGLFYSANYGVNWAASNAPTGQYYYSISSSPSGQYVAATTSSYRVYFSQNYGATYAQTLAPNVIWYSSFCTDDGVIAVSTYSYMYRSTNLGTTWSQYGDSSSGVMTNIATDSSSTNMVGISNTYGLVMQSTNGGAKWSTPSSLTGSTLSPLSTATSNDFSTQAIGTNNHGVYVATTSGSSTNSGGSGSGMSGGAVAGVVIGVLLGVGGIAVAVYFFVFRKVVVN